MYLRQGQNLFLYSFHLLCKLNCLTSNRLCRLNRNISPTPNQDVRCVCYLSSGPRNRAMNIISKRNIWHGVAGHQPPSFCLSASGSTIALLPLCMPHPNTQGTVLLRFSGPDRPPMHSCKGVKDDVEAHLAACLWNWSQSKAGIKFSFVDRIIPACSAVADDEPGSGIKCQPEPAGQTAPPFPLEKSPTTPARSPFNKNWFRTRSHLRPRGDRPIPASELAAPRTLTIYRGR